MKKINIILCLLICALTSFGQQTGTFTDPRDRKVYKTVVIGTQRWMAENLAYKPGNGNYTAYDNNLSNVIQYGYLYSWETAKNVCPPGWHLPTSAEWETLINYLGGKEVAGRKLKESGSAHWKDENDATNISGFTALPGGASNSSGVFASLGIFGFWWSASEADAINATSCLSMYAFGSFDRNNVTKKNNFSVRCIKDEIKAIIREDGTFSDQRDGKTYKTVKIGTQTWMAENLAYKPGSGKCWPYENIQGNVAVYGYLYDWDTANKVSPAGWHLPSLEEWIVLINFLGSDVAGSKLKEKGTKHWKEPNNANNSTGFSALPNGCYFNGKEFAGIGYISNLWTSTEKGINDAYYGYIDNRITTVDMNARSKTYGNSVRCIKD